MTTNNNYPEEEKCQKITVNQTNLPIKSPTTKDLLSVDHPNDDLNEDRILTCKQACPETESTGLSKNSKLGFCLVDIWKSFLKVLNHKLALQKLRNNLHLFWQQTRKEALESGKEMLTAMDKGIEAAQCATPPTGTYQGVDLKILPKYICFKASMIKEKMTLKYVLIIHSVFFILLFFTSRFEIHGLEAKLREKEYILAPGVMDFTPASPQSVSDSYVVNAAMSFASLFGNVNSTNIDEQFKRLAEFMSPELRVQFLAETNEWRETVKNENLSEILRVTERELISSEDGYYQFTALTRRERYTNNESLGHVDETLQMTLKLIPPVRGKEWFLQIESLKRSTNSNFQNHEIKQNADQRGGK